MIYINSFKGLITHTHTQYFRAKVVTAAVQQAFLNMNAITGDCFSISHITMPFTVGSSHTMVTFCRSDMNDIWQESYFYSSKASHTCITINNAEHIAAFIVSIDGEESVLWRVRDSVLMQLFLISSSNSLEWQKVGP